MAELGPLPPLPKQQPFQTMALPRQQLQEMESIRRRGQQREAAGRGARQVKCWLRLGCCQRSAP